MPTSSGSSVCVSMVAGLHLIKSTCTVLFVYVALGDHGCFSMQGWIP